MGNVFFKAQEDLPRRVIRPLDEHTAMAYSDNTVTNSRYTFYSFLPVNLYEQFRRPINFYFLLVTALQFIPVIAPVNPLSTLVPLVFAFSLTAIKEGYDDVKRHRQDDAYNSKYRCVLDRSTKEWQYKHNSSICVGDVVMIGQNEELPCDMIVVAASGKQTVYVRTDNLDGEIDLKQRDVVAPPRPTTTSPNVVSSVDVPLAVTDTVEEMLEKLSRLTLHCPPPSSIIEAFDGRADFVGHAQDPATLEPTLHMEQTTTEVSMTFRHLLPQSSYLKNTERALAIAVYTGNDTKCGMNKRAPPRKWAKIDRHISRYSMFIFCAQLICAAIFGLTGFLSNRNLPERAWYLPQPTHEPPAFLVYPLRFFLLTTAMIPISFKFIVDMSKYYMSMMVEWDASMMHGAEREGCKVKNSSILEDLGQIDYVLSDKTGTMTQNVMELMYLYVAEVEQEIHLGAIATPPSIAGSPTYACEAFTDAVEEEPIAVDAMVFSNIPQVMEMATALALCNNVEVVHTISTNTVSFQATSPDETALCCGAAKLNAVLYQRTETEAVVKVNDVERRWRIHVVFPFSSEKKSMGMLAEDEQSGRIYFLVKGADDRILSMVAPKTQGRDDGVWLSRLSDQLSAYACTGLRTLLVASKEISRSSLNEFLDKYTAASTLLDGRQEKLDELRLSMETNVRVLGITAIEDKLQDGVQETVCSLQEAGIKLWMLTGDKVETAEQIGLCCKLYAPGDRIIRVVETDPHSNSNSNSNNTRRWDEELMEMDINAMFPPQTKMTFSKQWLGSLGGTMQQKVLHYSPDTPDDVSTVSADMPTVVESPEGGRPTRSVLIVQGGAVLHSILTIPALRQKFAELSYHCNSVICARTTPSQKAAITTLVRSSGHVVLSIGDGGNDVAMLQEAEVGVGIAGKEGKQAARAADFVVSQFSDLRPLLLVHGQQSYVRTAYVIKYSFYKSMLIAMLQLVFNLFYTHISGASFWNSYSLMMWNGVYTLPQTFLYCLDRCAPRVVLERTPSLYKLTRAGMDLMWSEFFGSYLARGVIQSSLLLWLTMKCLGPTFSLAHHGWAETNDVAFTIAYTSLIFSQLFTLLWESHSITIWNLFFLVGMPVFYLVATLAYSSIPALDYYGVFAKTLHVEMWVIVITITAVLLVPFLVLFGLRNAQWPNCRDLLSAAEVQRQQRLLKQRGYRKEQSWFVRAPLGMTPEAISSFVDKGNILGVAGDALSMVSYGITGTEV